MKSNRGAQEHDSKGGGGGVIPSLYGFVIK